MRTTIRPTFRRAAPQRVKSPRDGAERVDTPETARLDRLDQTLRAHAGARRVAQLQDLVNAGVDRRPGAAQVRQLHRRHVASSPSNQAPVQRGLWDWAKGRAGRAWSGTGKGALTAGVIGAGVGLMASNPVGWAIGLGLGATALAGYALGGNYDSLKGIKGLTLTQNGRYGIDPRKPSVLYSAPGATPPVPLGLYLRNEIMVSKRKVVTWRPNVRLLGDEEQELADEEKLQESWYDKEKESLETSGARWAVLGRNDCFGFATTIQHLILAEKAGGAEMPGGSVGERWMHQYKPGAGCKYHGAIVVASDGGSDVTLEAHVSKDLKAPQFHIRGGIEGFIEDNQRGNINDIGTKRQVWTLDDLKPDAYEDYKDMYGRNYDRTNEIAERSNPSFKRL